MSNSFVPKIKMSKGTSRKTKFDVSSNTHTTSEVGYLQPTYSKILMPNSDLSIKANDSVLMSSLVVPTFGDLYLRHWFMATPVSSLWTPLGSFLSGRACVDRDGSLGYSTPKQMPRETMRTLIYLMNYAPFFSHTNSGTLSVTPSLVCGNLTYAFNVVGEKRGDRLMSFDEIMNESYRWNLDQLSPSDDDSGVVQTCYNVTNMRNMWSQYSYGTRFPLDASVNHLSMRAYVNSKAFDNFRLSTPVFPWWFTGLVIKNTAELQNMLTKKINNGDSAPFTTYTNFPSPADCPYVVMFVRSPSYYLLKNGAYSRGSQHLHSDASVGDYFAGGYEFFPLTMRMFQGDTDPELYSDGWINDVNLFVDIQAPQPTYKYFACHPTGESYGWSLSSDDSYFTGDLSHTDFDYCARQYWQQHDADYESNPEDVMFYAAGNWSRRYKRLRKLFIGFGQQFNPFDGTEFTPWKFMSYYKSWFDNFHPKRDIQYYQTPLARVVDFLSYHSMTWKDDFLIEAISGDAVQGRFNVSLFTNAQFFRDFIDVLFACADAKYLMPLDYFTLADLHPLESSDLVSTNQTLPVILDVNQNSYGSLPTENQEINSGTIGQNAQFTPSSYPLNGWAVKMADKMLKYLTKRRVVGKSVSDTMRAMFGAVDEHDKAHESTWCFGTSSTKLNISAVMSQAETEEMHLGDFAGRGLGGSESRTFSIDNNADLLVVIVMSAIVPRLGYYQGNLKENHIGASLNDFCRPIYDGVGYDDVDANEYIADVMHYDTYDNSNSNRDMQLINGHILGLVPRYTWYKVARDIVNGDMSLPSTKVSMSPYVLTRDVDKDFTLDPLEMRTVDPLSFNKIFNESSSLDDHFIIQMGFNVNLFAPLKSISTSFEDFDEDEDGSIEVEHS